MVHYGFGGRDAILVCAGSASRTVLGGRRAEGEGRAQTATSVSIFVFVCFLYDLYPQRVG